MSNREQIDAALEILRECYFYRFGKLLVCGNGGSAADCDHIVAELMKGMSTCTPYDYALPAISLASNGALISAITNDIGADYIFSQQVYGYGEADDVLLAISTSGISANVLMALKAAKKKGMEIIGLTGAYTDEFDKFCDVVISCPGSDAAEIQEQHIKVYHELCRRLEAEYFG